MLDLKEIIYIESLGEGCCIYTNTSEYIRREPLKYWINRLPKKEFTQTHRAFIINLRYVNNIESNFIYMKNGSKIPVSVRKQKILKHVLYYLKFFGRVGRNRRICI